MNHSSNSQPCLLENTPQGLQHRTMLGNTATYAYRRKANHAHCRSNWYRRHPSPGKGFN